MKIRPRASTSDPARACTPHSRPDPAAEAVRTAGRAQGAARGPACQRTRPHPRPPGSCAPMFWICEGPCGERMPATKPSALISQVSTVPLARRMVLQGGGRAGQQSAAAWVEGLPPPPLPPRCAQDGAAPAALVWRAAAVVVAVTGGTAAAADESASERRAGAVAPAACCQLQPPPARGAAVHAEPLPAPCQLTRRSR